MFGRPHSFHENMRFALILSQCFGIMPLHNIGKNVQHVKFKFVSLKFLFALLHFGCVMATGVACVLKLALKGFLIDDTGKYLNY